MKRRLAILATWSLIGLGCAAEPGPATDMASRDGGGARTQSAGQVGKASYYHPNLDGRRTASGEIFDADSNIAASKTLPLGTRARVTNLETGRSATVRIADRGPHVPGRIIDVSPRTAEDLGMKEEGTARVQVTPVGGSAGRQDRERR